MFIADLAAACSFLDMWPRKVACIFVAALLSPMEQKLFKKKGSPSFESPQSGHNRSPWSSVGNSSCSVDSEGSSVFDAVSDTLRLFLALCPRKAACIFVAAASFSLSSSAFSPPSSAFVALLSAAFEISSNRSNKKNNFDLISCEILCESVLPHLMQSEISWTV